MEPSDGATVAAAAGFAGLVALAMAAGSAWSLVHMLRHAPEPRLSAVALALQLGAALGAVALACFAIRWRARRAPGAVIGALDNTTGALMALPSYALLLAGLVLEQDGSLSDRVPGVGIALFGGVMVLAWPALGLWLSLGRARWQVAVGNLLGAVILVAGWGIFAVLWIVAVAGFAA